MGVKDFCPNFPKLTRKIFVPRFVRIFSYEDHIGRYFLKPKHVGRHFCSYFQGVCPDFQGFCEGFHRFCPGFPRFCPDFQGFCPDLHQIKTSAGCTPRILHSCAPGSYTTECVLWIRGPYHRRHHKHKSTKNGLPYSSTLCRISVCT